MGFLEWRLDGLRRWGLAVVLVMQALLFTITALTVIVIMRTLAIAIEATVATKAKLMGIALGLQVTSAAIVSIAVAEQLAAITWLAEKQVFAFEAFVAEVSIAQVAPVEVSIA